MAYDLKKIPIVDTSVKIPYSDYVKRSEELREKMAERKIDVGLAFGTPYLPGDVMYLTGFDTAVENAIALISKDKLIVIVGPEGSYPCRENIKYGEYRTVQELQIPTEEYLNTKSIPIKDVISELYPGKVNRVGILTRPDIITIDAVEIIKEAIPSAEFLNESDILYNMRYIKSIAELAMLRISNRITIEGVKAMCESVEIGMTELELTAIGDYVMKSMGAYNFGFDSFIHAGVKRTNSVMDRGSNKVIEEGDPICIGTAARYEGYAATARRMAVAGGFSKKQINYYEKFAIAQEIAAEHYKYGLPKNGIEKAVIDYWKKQGLFKYKIYSVTHGTGIAECLEGISFTNKSEGTIEKNIAHMLDCGLYDHPEFGGCSIENPYIINESGVQEDLASSYYPFRNWKLQ